MELQTDVTRSGGQRASSTHARTNTINAHEPSRVRKTSLRLRSRRRPVPAGSLSRIRDAGRIPGRLTKQDPNFTKKGTGQEQVQKHRGRAGIRDTHTRDVHTVTVQYYRYSTVDRTTGPVWACHRNHGPTSQHGGRNHQRQDKSPEPPEVSSVRRHSSFRLIESTKWVSKVAAHQFAKRVCLEYRSYRPRLPVVLSRGYRYR